MKIFSILLFVVLLISCRGGQSPVSYLEKADGVTIQFYKLPDLLSRVSLKREQIDVLAETVMDGGGEAALQDTTGRMLFTQKDSLLLEVYFSTPNTGSKFSAPVFAFVQDKKAIGGRFTYKAGILLEEIFNELRIKK